ncbi:MAG: nucleotidyltransferase domain-containing protein [Anaerolineae bacterium]
MASRYLNSSRVASKTQQRARNYPHWPSVERFVAQVRQLEPLLVLLFGSVATGEFTQYSDADVLVIFQQSVPWEMVYACSDGFVQPVVKTWREIEAKVRSGEPFYCEIAEDALVLFDAGGVYEQLQRLTTISREYWGLERTSSGWRWTAGERTVTHPTADGSAARIREPNSEYKSPVADELPPVE